MPGPVPPGGRAPALRAAAGGWWRAALRRAAGGWRWLVLRLPAAAGGRDGAIAAALAAAALALRLPRIAAHPQGWDAIDFALALERYNLAAMQPHFPGYPVYVWLGWLARRWAPDPFAALAGLSAGAGALAVGVWYLLARHLLRGRAPVPAPAAAPGPGRGEAPVPAPRWPALAVAAWVALSPLAWLSSEQAMSDSPGFLAASLFLLAAWRWLGRGGVARALAAGALLGLTLGVRLSYFPLGLTLLAILVRRRSAAEGAGAVLGGLLGTVPWLAWQVAQDGLGRFLALALQFTGGHLGDWGGAVGAAHAVSGRAGLFWWRNWLGLGLGGPAAHPRWGWLVAAALAAGLWAGLRPPGALRQGRSIWTGARRGLVAGLPGFFLLAWGLPYLAWAYWGQNPENPRHLLPVLPLPMLLAVRGWAALPLPRRVPGWLVPAAVAAVLLAVGAAAWPLVVEHQRTPPPMVALAEFLRRQDPPVRGPVFTWQEERAIRYYAPGVIVHRLRSPAQFERVLLAAPAPPERVWATSALLDGFGPAGADLRRFFRPVAAFRGNPLVYTTYHEITLYEAGPQLYDYVRQRGAGEPASPRGGHR